MDKIFFETNNGPLTQEDFLNSLKLSGINYGDTVMVHTQVFTIGKLAKAITKEELTNMLIDSLLMSVGPEGTLIFPTFNFEYCKTSHFDSYKTPSAMGLLSEAARLRSDSIRTDHPIYSVAIMGSDAERFHGASLKTCFGKESLFAQLHEENEKTGKVKFLTIGIESPPIALTYVHHLEELQNVPYRYHKDFSGVDFFVRDEKVKVVYDDVACWNLWKENKIENCINFGNSIICMVPEKELYEVTMNKIESDPEFLCKGGYKGSPS